VYNKTVSVVLIGLSTWWVLPVFAQEKEEAEPVGVTSALLEAVVVTARKREEPLQQVPISISAFSSEQVDALKVRDLMDLSVWMPNVAMDDVGTFKGTANFSIRGLGVNSSIPGVEPTVGVFIDGVYIGQNAGIVIDMFDIERLEVLRGPQGTLFGRNVTGGAVLISTKKPTDEFELSLRAAMEGNPNGDGGSNYYMMGSVSGPLGDNFAGRLSVYHNEDNGWFKNLHDGSDFGAASTTIVRPSISWSPTDRLELQLRWDHTESNGDGPAGQTHTNGSGVGGFPVNFDRDSFDFSIDEAGKSDFELDFVTFQLDWDVAFGNGTITNIFAYRDFYQESTSDIDAQPVWLFHVDSINSSEQFSNELRYNGIFGNANVTAGVYWFDHKINYSEIRNLLGVNTENVAPALTQSGGGILDVQSLAFFAAVDYLLNDAWSINAGIRYTNEDKHAQIATLTRNVNNPCLVYTGTCNFDFIDGKSWGIWSGKLGFTYGISTEQRMYAHWSRGHRSGGYNLRNTALDTVNFGPGPFDQETADSFEIGFKSEPGGRGHLNAAVFYTAIDDMQRVVIQTDPFAAVVQVIKNTADVDIFGFEVEGTFAVGSNTVLFASLGWVHPEYKTVRFDLNGDGVVDEKDKALKLPRAAKWTYTVGLNHDWVFDGGSALSFRINYAYRDDAFALDNNLGYFLSQNILNAGFDYRTPRGRWVLSLYGRNLLGSVNHGGDAQLPASIGSVATGGTFATLMKGRVVGVQIEYNF
jgi:iron complex outermembrane receptor protein